MLETLKVAAAEAREREAKSTAKPDMSRGKA